MGREFAGTNPVILAKAVTSEEIDLSSTVIQLKVGVESVVSSNIGSHDAVESRFLLLLQDDVDDTAPYRRDGIWPKDW